MRCPVCENNNLKVVDTAADDNRVIRRRRCMYCGQIFYSEETLRLFSGSLPADLAAAKNEVVDTDAVINSRKFVLVNGGITKSAALAMMHEIVGQLDEILVDVRRDSLITTHLIVRFVADGERIQNLRCDECFGFDRFDVEHLRKGGVSGRFEGSLVEYILKNA